MLTDFNFLSDIYIELYNWIVCNTPGEYRGIRHFKNYDKNVWKPIKYKIQELEKNNKLTDLEKEFLKCKYVGSGYRVFCYDKRKKGQVYIINTYQSCSKSEQGVKNVTNLHGELVLIQLYAYEEQYAIDVFELLCFMYKNKLINIEDCKCYDPKRLVNYEKEEEVLIPITGNTIRNIYIVNYEKNEYRELLNEKWFRKSIW